MFACAFAGMFLFSSLSYSQDDELTSVPSPVSGVGSTASTRSYNDCWDFWFLPQSHTFNCGSCKWYTISATHDSSTSKTIEIQERDAGNNIVSTYVTSIPAGGSLNYANPNPSSGTVKILVTISGLGVIFGTVCIATL